jgi:hypothetical protein
VKSLVSQHERRPGAGFLIESRAVGDDGGRLNGAQAS